LLSLQFEQAIAFLDKTDFRFDGVHFAIALNHYKMLNRNDDQTNMLSRHDDSSPTSINLKRILQKYIEPFQYTNPQEAFHYLYLLHDDHQMSNAIKINTCGEAVAKLIIDTREYDALIGFIKPSYREQHIEKSGCVYRYFKEEEAKHIILCAGEMAERDCNYIDALRLYRLARAHDIVVRLLIDQLALVVGDETMNPDRRELIEIATQFLRLHRQRPSQRASGSPYYRGVVDPHPVDEELVQTLEILVYLSSFFDLYHEGPDKYDEALRLVEERVCVVPLASDTPNVQARRYEQFHQTIKQNLPNIAAACDDIYSKKKKQINADIQAQRAPGLFSPHQPDISSRTLDLLQKKQENLHQFVTIVGYTPQGLFGRRFP